MNRCLLGWLLLMGLSLSPSAFASQDMNSGDTAWMLTSTLLVIMMTLPGLALFYGGLVRRKNALSVLLQVFATFALVTLLWVIYGYSFVFVGEGRVIGGATSLFLNGINSGSLIGTIPAYVFVAFQCAFAAITLALIIGSFVERIRFAAVMIFVMVWFTLCYLPIAHMIWGGGWLANDGALDFAGGTVIHINAGIAALVAAVMVGKRLNYRRMRMAPHSLALTMSGAALLWVGWFGFNAGSALAADGSAALAAVNTLVAPAAAMLSWLATESFLQRRVSALGAASGVVAGLVAITPAAGYVGPAGAIFLGLVSAPVCFWGVTGFKHLFELDDSCDVFGIHGIGGILGALLTGVFADKSLGGIGLDVSILHQLWVQFEGVVITCMVSAVVAWVAFKMADLLVGLRVSEDDERRGLDVACHGERAYND